MNIKRLNKALYLEWKMSETPLALALVCGLCSILFLVADFMFFVFMAAQFIAIIYVIDNCCKKNVFGEEAVFCRMVGRTIQEEILSKIMICTLAIASLIVFSGPMFLLITSNFERVIDLGGGIFGEIPMEDYFPVVALFVVRRLTLSVGLAAFAVLTYYYTESSARIKSIQTAILILIVLAPYIMRALGGEFAAISRLLSGFDANLTNLNLKYLVLMAVDLGLAVLFYKLTARKAEKIWA